jgi:hypothetical protein
MPLLSASIANGGGPLQRFAAALFYLGLRQRSADEMIE